MLHTSLVLLPIAKGIALAAAPGPITFEMIHQGVSKSTVHAFLVRLGANLSTFLILLLTLLTCYLSSSLQSSDLYNSVGILLSALGSLFMLFKGLRQLYMPIGDYASNNSNQAKWSTLLIGMSFGIANPMVWVFWISLFQYSSTTNNTTLQMQGIEGVLIIAGMTIWGLLLSLSIQKIKQSDWIKIIAKCSGAALFIIGCMMFYQVFQLLHTHL